MSVAQSNVPDLMKLGSIPVNLEQDIETSVLDPVVFNQSFARFSLERKGFLHSFSRLTLSLDAPTNASNVNATYPANVGIHSLIDRATLKVGAKTICEVEDFSKYMAYKSMFIQNDINKERESVLTGRIMNHGFKYKQTAGVGHNYHADGLTIDNGTELLVTLNATATPDNAFYVPENTGITETNASFNANGVQVNDNLLLKNTPVLQIALSDLFPFLRYNQLPLFMMDEQVSIELVFTPQTTDDRFTFAGVAPHEAERLNITQGNCQMVADYIFYNGQLMNDYQNANREMNWNYIDYRLTKRTYANGVGTQQILNVGGAGRIVNKLICAQNYDTASATSVVGQYGAWSTKVNTDNVGQLTSNVRYNDHFLYPIARSLSAIQFHDVAQTENGIPYITRDEYNCEGGGVLGGGLSDVKYNGHDISLIDTGLRGKFFWQAHRLNRNERISSRGIELETLYSALGSAGSTDNFTQRVWIEIVRNATLINGRMNCYWA
tara:strand:+ start:1552 stop:3033 length:1482 start_codon:yes stop_codon:yes gene_type:complete